MTSRYGINLRIAIENQYTEQFQYGHREILLEYANLSMDLMFKAIIPHGKITPHFVNPIRPSYEIRDGSEILQLLWRDDSSQEARKLGFVNTKSMGTPFLYALANQKQTISSTVKNLNSLSSNFTWVTNQQQNVLEGSRKITYFPLHSWEGNVHQHTVPQDFLLKRIDPSRVTVCLGFLDFCNPEVRKTYTELGWQLTCAGVRESKIVGSPSGGRNRFLYNLIEIISDADFIVANEFTTGLFYAAAQGKGIGILPTTNHHELIYSSWENGNDFNMQLNKERELFPWLWGEIASKDRIMSDLTTALGIESFKQPEFFQTSVEKITWSGYGSNIIK